MANLANLRQMTGLVLSTPVSSPATEIANAAAYYRTPLPQSIPGDSGGSTAAPVGPQRWPL